MPSPKQTAQRSPAWRQRFRGQFLKTKMCRFYAAGHCRFEEGCPFAHDPKDLSVAPDLRKTSLCEAWKRGTCKFSSADDCPFAHGDGDLNVTRAFVDNPLSKRVRATAENRGMASPSRSETSTRSSETSPVHSALQNSHTPKELAMTPAAYNCTDGTTAGRTDRRQQRRNSERAEDPFHFQQHLHSPDWENGVEDKSPSYMPRPFVDQVGEAPWLPAVHLNRLMPPMFTSAPPEVVAEMLRQAMPDYYED
jgi:hypothetical protein